MAKNGSHSTQLFLYLEFVMEITDIGIGFNFSESVFHMRRNYQTV